MGEAGCVGLVCPIIDSVVESLWADDAPASISRSEAQQDAFWRGIDSPVIYVYSTSDIPMQSFQFYVLGVFMVLGSDK
jgi:hypothetical protein